MRIEEAEMWATVVDKLPKKMSVHCQDSSSSCRRARASRPLVALESRLNTIISRDERVLYQTCLQRVSAI